MDAEQDHQDKEEVQSISPIDHNGKGSLTQLQSLSAQFFPVI